LKGGRLERAAQIPEWWKPNDVHRELARTEGVDLEVEVVQFRDHAQATGRVLKNWDAGFRNWLRKAKALTPRKPTDWKAARQEEERREVKRREDARRRAQESKAREQEAEADAERQHIERLRVWWKEQGQDVRDEIKAEAKEKARQAFGRTPPGGLVEAWVMRVTEEKAGMAREVSSG
jgi:hypothetical protein